MQQEVYYLIRPNRRLQRLLAKQDDQVNVGIFGQATLWRRSEGATRLDTDADRLPLVKLIFLGDLKQRWGEDEVFLSVFGEAFELSVETFDRYWELERFAVEDDLDVVFASLDYGTLDQMVRTHNPRVDKHIGWMKRRLREEGS